MSAAMGQTLATWLDAVGRDSLEHRRFLRRARRRSSLRGTPVVVAGEARPGKPSVSRAEEPEDGPVADLSRVSAEQLLEHRVEAAYLPPKPLTLMRRRSSHVRRSSSLGLGLRRQSPGKPHPPPTSEDPA